MTKKQKKIGRNIWLSEEVKKAKGITGRKRGGKEEKKKHRE